MEKFSDTAFLVLLFAIFLGWGYYAGVNDGLQQAKAPKEFYLPESMWQETYSYQRCMQDRSCRIFVRAEK